MVIHYLYEDGIETSIPLDPGLSSLGKPPDAKWGSSGQTFLPNPHTQNIFL